MNNFAVSSVELYSHRLANRLHLLLQPEPCNGLCPELDNRSAPGHNRNHDADHYAARDGCRCPSGLQAALPGHLGGSALLPGLQEAQPALHAHVARSALRWLGLCLRLRRHVLEQDIAAGHVHSHHHRDSCSRACRRVGIGAVYLYLNGHPRVGRSTGLFTDRGLLTQFTRARGPRIFFALYFIFSKGAASPNKNGPSRREAIP